MGLVTRRRRRAGQAHRLCPNLCRRSAAVAATYHLSPSNPRLPKPQNNKTAANWRPHYRRFHLNCQPRLCLYGSLLRSWALARYSATAAGVVTQLFPTLKARSLPVLAKSLSWEILSPNRADASVIDISRSSSSNGPLACTLKLSHYNLTVTQAWESRWWSSGRSSLLSLPWVWSEE